jgi:DNA-binding response OmpR family regulator
MVTAETEAEDLLQGLHGGADGYIFKPFQAEALIQCIRKVLNI